MSSTRMNRILGRRSACLPASATRAGGALCANAAAPGTVAIAAKLIAAVAKNLLGAEKRSGAGAFSEAGRSEEHTSELQSLMRISYAVFCLKKKKQQSNRQKKHNS